MKSSNLFQISSFSVLYLFGYLQAEPGTSTVVLDTVGIQNLGIQTVEAEEMNFETTVFAIGRIEAIPAKHSVLSSRIAGRIVQLNAFEGDSVETGQVLATVETRQLGDPPPTIELKSPQSGLIVKSHVFLGQPVEPNLDLLDISDRAQMWAVAKIPEQSASKIDVGSIARIHIPALGENRISAKLMRFGVDADRKTGTIEGIFQIENPDNKLRPGMRAEFSIVTDTRTDVLAVPREAVQGQPAKRTVFIKDFDLPNVFIQVPVVLGEDNDRFVEIVSGVFPGDEVVTQGAYSLLFAGGSSGMTLKEALDAAHGHEHNEDGSEMTEEQRRAREEEKKAEMGTTHEHSHHLQKPLIIYAGVITCLFVIVAQLLWRKRSPEQA